MTSYNDLIKLSRSNLEEYLSNPYLPNNISSKEVFICALECAYESDSIIQSALSKRDSSDYRISNATATKCSEADLVTETDVAVEEMIKSKIFQKFSSRC